MSPESTLLSRAGCLVWVDMATVEYTLLHVLDRVSLYIAQSALELMTLLLLLPERRATTTTCSSALLLQP